MSDMEQFKGRAGDAADNEIEQIIEPYLPEEKGTRRRCSRP